MTDHHIQVLKEHKLSLTPVRLAVLEAIESDPHANADIIFQTVKKKISTTSKQAIYHNLNTLVNHEIIREIKPKGKSSLYETRTGDNHHHIVCRDCGAVVDTDCFDVAPCLEPMNSHGFKVDEAEVTFWGICPSCQK